MSATSIFYSIRNFKDGYRGYWLSECPGSSTWKHGFYWDGVGPHHATTYTTHIQAKEAAQHFINRGSLKEEEFFLEVHAPSTAEIVGHLHSEGFDTIADNWEHTWATGQIGQGRLLVNRETDECCFVFRETFLRAVGCFIKILYKPEVEQLSLFEK